MRSRSIIRANGSIPDPVVDVRLGLIKRAVEGDELALSALLAESRSRLLRLVSCRIPAVLKPSIEADDIVQQAHVEIFRRIKSFRNQNVESFDRWTSTILLRQLLNALRELRALKRGGGQVRLGGDRRLEDSSIALWNTLVGPGKTPSRVAARREAALAVHSALDGLPAHYRKAIWSIHIEGCPVREVACALGKTERAVHALCRRGLARMRRQLRSVSKFLSSTH
ncbi:MAG: RNA polymerase sigma factor [Planctomycetota bacterium]